MSGLTLSAHGLAIGAVLFVFVWCCAAATWWLLHDLFGGDQ